MLCVILALPCMLVYVTHIPPTCANLQLLPYTVAAKMILPYQVLSSRTSLVLRTKWDGSSYEVSLKFDRSCPEGRSKLSRRSFEVALKFVRSCTEVRSKLTRSSCGINCPEICTKFVSPSSPTKLAQLRSKYGQMDTHHIYLMSLMHIAHGCTWSSASTSVPVL